MQRVNWFPLAAIFFPEPPSGRGHDSAMNALGYFLSILWFMLGIAAIVDCVRSDNPSKILWLIVIILLPYLGAILYFVLGRTRDLA